MAAYVYVLLTREPGGRALTYVGWSLDLDRRLAEHNGAGKRGAKSTRARHWLLVYAERHRTRKGAMKREYVLKKNREFRAMLREHCQEKCEAVFRPAMRPKKRGS